MALFFYLFASLITVSSILVVLSRNPVYSVLWLILTFCNASALIVLLGAEFISMILIVIYVGAVAVLFLFVIMMLDLGSINIKHLKQNIASSLFIASLLLANLTLIIYFAVKSAAKIKVESKNLYMSTSNSWPSSWGYAIDPDVSNSLAIGKVLYTDFFLPFQISGIILFVAMISCITLTHRYRAGVKRQNPGLQMKSSKGANLIVRDVQSNNGVKDINYE